MTPRVVVVICNWNKKDYLADCIDSVWKSSYSDFDIIVVDNDSSDGSVELVKATYGSKLKIICNPVNKGGAGGFNAGLREALSGNYEYIYLLDNDVRLDSDAMGELVKFLDNHDSYGAAGSKLYMMDYPEKIQEMGADIDWENFHVSPHYKGYIDHEKLPDVVQCDYVPACSVMVRAAVLSEVGIMDENYFIYWDDIEWFHRMKLQGYKIAAISKSKVWHKMGAANRTTTFPTYYFWRNRVHFFSKYTPTDQISRLAEVISREMFQAMFFSSYRGQYKTAQTTVLAVNDAVRMIRGRAGENRIQEREPQPSLLDEILLLNKRIAVVDCSDLRVVRNTVDYIARINPDASLIIIASNYNTVELQEQFPTIDILDHVSQLKDVPHLLCQTLGHILDVRHISTLGAQLYIDQYLNTIYSERDMNVIHSYDEAYQMHSRVYGKVLETEIRELRKSIDDQKERER